LATTQKAQVMYLLARWPRQPCWLPTVLNALKVGDKVKFSVVNEGGWLTITALQVLKP
jgi:hypothetical protein